MQVYHETHPGYTVNLGDGSGRRGIAALVPRVALPLGVRQHEGSTPYRSVSGDRQRRTKSSALQVKASAAVLGSLEMGHFGGE